MNQYNYQLNYSETQPKTYNEAARSVKARKIISILNDFFRNKSINEMHLLDIGSSTGYITHILSQDFASTVGIDIDENGVDFAQKKFSGEKLRFLLQDSMDIQFPDNTFDVVNCTQIYEHVPDSKRLISEIYRVLKPGGICFFAAGNRINFMEPHYKLPLLSVFPKFIAHRYVRLFRNANYYYETHLTYWGLKELVRDFNVVDYTIKVIEDPIKYHATDMLKPGSIVQKMVLFILKIAYWACPTYLWILQKKTKLNNHR